MKTSNKSVKVSNIEHIRGYKLPVVLTCTVTGKTIKYSVPKYIDKKIAEYGSLNRMHKHFISREGRRVLKEQSAKTEKNTVRRAA